MDTKLKKALYEQIMKAVSKEVKKALNEVSPAFMKKAKDSAVTRIEKLSKEFFDSNFLDTLILALLLKLAGLRDRFTDYIKVCNDYSADMVAGPLKRIIKKWSSGRLLSNGVVFKPVFTLESNEEKYEEVVKQRWERDFVLYKREGNEDLQYKYLVVIGLNSDFSEQIKTGKKLNMDYSQYELLQDEYEKVNKELKDELEAIDGIEFYWEEVNRRNRRNPYDTISMTFKIDTNLIDTETLSTKLSGYSHYETKRSKTAGSVGGTRDGIHFSGVPYGTFKTRKLHINDL